MNKRWKQYMAWLWVVVLVCVGYAGACAQADETVDIELPYPEFSELFEDEVHALTANALSNWYMEYGMIFYQWSEELWQRKLVFLANPYFFKEEYSDESELVVYCSGAIAACRLLKDEEIEFVPADFVLLFRVYFREEEDNTLKCVRVEPVWGKHEELYPGAGIGTDGFPALSDALAREMPNDAWVVTSVAEKYLELYGIDAKVYE